MSGGPSYPLAFEAALRGRPLSSAMPITYTRDNTARVTAEFPPLPPPRQLQDGIDVEWQWRDRPAASDFGRHGSARASSNLVGGSSNLHGERPLAQRTLEQSSVSYDKQQLSLFGGPNASTAGKRPSISFITGSPATDVAVRHPNSVPEDGVLQRGGYDRSSLPREEYLEDARMSSMQAHSHSPTSDEHRSRIGLKRRASSPPREMLNGEHTSVNSSPAHDGLHRRPPHQAPGREPHPSRQHPSHSSLSSVSSYSFRKGSLSNSSLGLPSIASSTTSFGSGHLSPMGRSPAFDFDPHGEYAQTTTQTARQATRPPSPHHQRDYSGASHGASVTSNPEGMPHSRTSSVSQINNAAFVCECCPKKPKKFETREELRIHESEKQYSCQYCNNRFKNKNEAERHQNSLHIRRNSWSCAALSGVEAAFHPSASPTHDVCGYCGSEFANPPRWDLRAEHLNHIHKFGECNQAKKFFRADHFRQHLKHSHAGTSGKWTNMLENACMKDEPPDRPLDRSLGSTTHPSHVERDILPALMVNGSVDTQMRMSP